MQKVVFLPHCLRSTNCPAKPSQEGYTCLECGKCKLAEVTRRCKEAGYNYYIVPGASIIKKIIRDIGKPDIIIGVACETEIKQARLLVNEKKFNAKAVLLTKTGCVNTDFDQRELYRLLDSR